MELQRGGGEVILNLHVNQYFLYVCISLIMIFWNWVDSDGTGGGDGGGGRGEGCSWSCRGVDVFCDSSHARV